MASIVVIHFKELHALLESKNTDEEMNKNLCCKLITELSKANFWIRGKIEEDADSGKQLLGMEFSSEPEISNKQILTLWCDTGSETRPAILENVSKDYLHCIPGVSIAMLTNEQRFDIIIIDEDGEPYFVRFEMLRYAITLYLSSNKEVSPPTQGNDYYKRMWPAKFCNWLYKYCCDNKSIVQCNVGLVNVKGGSEFILVVDFKCDYTEVAVRHYEVIKKIENDMLPSTMSLHPLSPDPEIFNGQILELFSSREPFYKSEYNKNIWSRLKRKLSPPGAIILELDMVN